MLKLLHVLKITTAEELFQMEPSRKSWLRESDSGGSRQELGSEIRFGTAEFCQAAEL